MPLQMRPTKKLMRILLSTIGSRGDVQPMAGLRLALQSRGQQVRICVPPDFVA
jgi:vancomycin aglycone glucosyltransferase